MDKPHDEAAASPNDQYELEAVPQEAHG
jgi:hypothetical protein